MTRNYESQDLDGCVQLLIEAYNCEPWNNHWTEETGKRYLDEFALSRNFVGFVATEHEELVGAMFAHRKTWWTNDKVFVDELFIKPVFKAKAMARLYATWRGLWPFKGFSQTYIVDESLYARQDLL